MQTTATDNQDTSNVQTYFKKLKLVCVPLMGASKLTTGSTLTTTTLLSQLVGLLNEIPPEHLTSNLISYVSQPLLVMLQRNSSTEMSDQILEKILLALRSLVESWWWSCEINVWEQIFRLCGAILGGIGGNAKGKGKTRDDETKEAAASCLHTLIRPRTPEEAVKWSLDSNEAQNRLCELQERTRKNPGSVPIIGQTLESALDCATSRHLPLQRVSLEIIGLLIDLYFPDQLIPSVLPGVASTMTKICLGTHQGKGWANGEIVSRGLHAMQVTIVKAIGDEVCTKHGALRPLRDLDDLMKVDETIENAEPNNESSYSTRRTESWLRGTATQLHIAVNTLTPLLSHPTPSALNSLCTFSATLIRSTPLTLPHTQPLLLAFLLSLSLSDYPSVSSNARQLLTNLLDRPSNAKIPLQQTLMQQLGNNLSALPRLLSTQAESRVSHVAGLVEAICRLASDHGLHSSLSTVAKGVGKLLGPTGGIEKWGLGLLTVLEIVEPQVVIMQTSAAQLALEGNPENPQLASFPELVFKNISSHETRDALENMFLALGATGGDSALFAVEWFLRLGCSGTSSTSVAALWCACRLLEGIAHISMHQGDTGAVPVVRPSKRLEKQVRTFARAVSEIWDQLDPVAMANNDATSGINDDSLLVQHQTGIVPLHETLKITHSTRPKVVVKTSQPVVHKALCLHLIAITAGVMQDRFNPLFIHSLYPILRSLVSPLPFLASTALATLNFVIISTSYASPGNLLLSNFDYILDSVSRRLTQRWLDIDATKVLGIMVRLVGADIVEKAGDVVEECFDRLDEFHGYAVVVDGLIEVIIEVIKVVEREARANPPPKSNAFAMPSTAVKVNLDDFFSFLPQRMNDPLLETDKTDYGPAPREPWEKKDQTEDEIDDTIGATKTAPVSSHESPPTPLQVLTKQMVTRSIYFLTHDSPVIRARILTLLTLAVPVLAESSLLPSIHSAWPFILNRLDDTETFVISAAAGLIEALSRDVGDFMFRRIWDDVWPRFRSILWTLEQGESADALTRRSKTKVGTDSAYTHTHRLYRSLIKTMTTALKGVHIHEVSFWEVIVLFRRFLSLHAHEELQHCALHLYEEATKSNPDAVWLLLTSTVKEIGSVISFLQKESWDLGKNASTLLNSVE
ncbi:unnamed protein product [Cyclocybe aegerita]|uniref:TEL2-interacting protein 1 n=1 Tax=Cyclocybe aegerita TaxID=1973307 RepID=A0A8S0W0Z5_CYCAE|nr:unnamed protein product [Cyclocybe aegerita]